LKFFIENETNFELDSLGQKGLISFIKNISILTH